MKTIFCFALLIGVAICKPADIDATKETEAGPFDVNADSNAETAVEDEQNGETATGTSYAGANAEGTDGANTAVYAGSQSAANGAGGSAGATATGAADAAGSLTITNGEDILNAAIAGDQDAIEKAKEAGAAMAKDALIKGQDGIQNAIAISNQATKLGQALVEGAQAYVAGTKNTAAEGAADSSAGSTSATENTGSGQFPGVGAKSDADSTDAEQFPGVGASTGTETTDAEQFPGVGASSGTETTGDAGNTVGGPSEAEEDAKYGDGAEQTGADSSN